MQSLTDRISEIIAPSLEAEGFAIVQIKLVDGKRRTLQLMLENAATGNITLDECARLSRTVSALLDVEDVIPGAYLLEVSSPGIDRPLMRRTDYERYLGFDAKIETALPVDGRRRFKGQLMAVGESDVTIRVDNTDCTLSFDNVHSAKLVLTDALIKAHQQGAFNPQKPELAE